MASSESLVERLPQTKPDVVYVETCRACSTGYDFKLKEGVVVTIICGRPPPSSKYKAVSYLWEMHDGVKVCLVCRHCEIRKVVPVKNAAKLWRIVNFVSGSEKSCKIWLDALSIDQDNRADLDAQLEVMGDIYRHAEIVSVLLPVGDEMAYAMLRKLAVVAQAIVDYEKSGKPNTWGLDETETELADVSNSFLEQMKEWVEKLQRWRYWSRAWTFQEWAMATELEITCELASHKEILCDIKNIVVMAATILGLWKNSQARLSGLSSGTLPDILIVREETGTFLNEVRLHFPQENALIADNELEGDGLRAQTFIAPSSAIDSGNYITLVSLRTKPLSVRAMLALSLNALTTNRRKARYDADLVACWASMCNIEYNYNNTDTVDVTLHKVLTALRRKKGLRIFNFQVNTTCGESDLKFEKYAAAMRQSNSKSKGFMFGSPAFTGRVDTITHMRLCLEEKSKLLDFKNEFNVKLQEISNAIFNDTRHFIDIEEVVSTIKALVSGRADGERLYDVVPLVQELLHGLSIEQLQHYDLVTVSVAVEDDPTMTSFKAWAICPSPVATLKLFVARESLNGTLVLATIESTVSTEVGSTQIVAYLNMTHQRDGTYLVKSDEKGVVDIVFRAADNPLFDPAWMSDLKAGMGDDFLDLGIMDVVDDRMFDVKIGLGEKVYDVGRSID